MKRYVLFFGLAVSLVVAVCAAALLPGPQASAHSGAEQLGVSVYGGCNNSLAPFIAARVSGYNQYGNYVTWSYGGGARCNIVTTNWWWQTWRGVRVQLTHQDGHVSCKVHYADDYWWQWWNTTVWVQQKYDDRC
jgi:hypothetical protein